jgi:NADP-dependent 3-hydroxy acid dehydrogenase YdfG
MVVWFITGCSSGFGQEVAKAALARGDKVVATARNASKLEDLKILGALTLSLDVTDTETEIEKVVAEAIKTYGVIDILLNNAGVILEGAIEEARQILQVKSGVDFADILKRRRDQNSVPDQCLRSDGRHSDCATPHACP